MSAKRAAPVVEQMPPADLAAEQVLIGACLISPDALAASADVVGPNDFYKPAHGELFTAILAVRAAGRPVDHVTVVDHLGQRLLKVGGAPYLHTCIAAVPTASNAGYWAEIVADKARRRELAAAGVRIAQLAQRPADDDLHELLTIARSVLADIAPTGRRNGRQLRATRASAVKARRQRWLWAGRIVLGGLTLLAGREGLGKSTIACDVCAQVTTGTLDGEYKGEPRTVIYLHSEDARDTTIVPRLLAAGADLDRVIFVDAVHTDEQGEIESQVVLPTDVAGMADLALDNAAALVVLDAATSVIDSRLDGDKDRQMRQGLESIARGIGERAGCAVLGVVHFGKRESGDTGKLILGSIAWSQVARSVLAVARDNESGDLVVSATKSNLAPGDAPSLSARLVNRAVPTDDGPTHVGRVEWLGETSQNARDLLAGPEQVPEDRTERATAEAWLEDYLTEQDKAPSFDAKKAARAAGIAERTLERARRSLGVISTNEGFPRKSYWSLPTSRASDATTPTRAHEHGATGATGPDQRESESPTGATAAVAPVAPRTAHEAAQGATGPAYWQSCERCGQPAERLHAGRCHTCAYPAGGGPDEEPDKGDRP